MNQRIPVACRSRCAVAAFLCVSAARAQGPAPETAPPLFPGGGLVSVDSVFTTRAQMPGASSGIPLTSRPTFSQQTDTTFTWGFYPNLDFTFVLPVVVNQFEARGVSGADGYGLGDALFLVKYRFYRRDSERGTTQASITLGPKIPSGRTNLTDSAGNRLPAALQPGSGSTDLFVGGNFTYTGLFHVRRLVADEDFHALLTSQGTQSTRLGDSLESRFWLSYRPYEAADGAREWFIGPSVTWLQSGEDRIGGAAQRGSGGGAVLAGITTYVGLRPGMHAWVAVDWDVAHSDGAQFMPVRRHISFGITQQFRMHIFR